MKHRRIFIVLIVLIIGSIATVEISRIMQKTQQLSMQAWTFPSDKTCDATSDINSRRYTVLKPQYYALQDDGTLTQLTTGCNAYSDVNVALVKQHSDHQFVTVSGNRTGIHALTSNGSLTSMFMNTMLTFLQSSGFTGVEIDFEDFGQWTAQDYSNYKAFLTTLGNTLHDSGYKLMIDGPAISDATYQGYYPAFRWEDFNAFPVDYLVVMAYDEQDDKGAGTPISSLSWISSICQWMLSKITDHSKIVIGIPSYGYHAKIGAYSAMKDTYQQSTQLPGFSTATRDASSGEMTWTNAGIFYDYSDMTTLQEKLKVVQDAGIQNVSVWHLGGGNFWFSQSTPTPAPSPTLSLTTSQIKAIYATLTPDQLAAISATIKS